MRRKLLIAVPLLALVALLAWMLRPRRENLGEAFVSEKVAPLLSSIAQVREQMGMLHYGERVDVVGKRNDYVKVRTNAGTVGWVESRQLMEPAVWQRSIKLLDQTRGMPVQARGRTKKSTNLHVQPGRTEPRLAQPNPQTPRSPAIRPHRLRAGWWPGSWSWICRIPCAKGRILQISGRWHGLN